MAHERIPDVLGHPVVEARSRLAAAGLSVTVRRTAWRGALAVPVLERVLAVRPSGEAVELVCAAFPLDSGSATPPRAGGG